MAKEVFGFHLMIDATACDIAAVTSRETIERFATTLVKAIDMVAYGAPQIEHFAAHNPKAGGYTLLQLIETSNIAGHFVDATGNAFIDIFSCKEFAPEIALRVFQETFNPKAIHHMYITREA